MAYVHALSRTAGLLSRLLTTDFCPWANRFVYWLKEPIGWFALATIVSLLVGLYLSPIGWTLAVSLTAIMLVGMAWPLLAIRVAACELRPELDCVHEGDACRIIVSVRNRIPLPVWGLAVEGYLDCEGEATTPMVALARVPPLCVCDFAITVKPTLRGRYPVQSPRVACSFPFGIWTARRKLPKSKALTVWPKVYAVQGVCPIVGLASTDHGDGSRGGRGGDFVGVRAYRRGDSAKQINWVASARVDTLIVTERGGPQCAELNILVDTSDEASREQLANRVRMAASVLIHLHQSGIPMRVMIGARRLRLAQGAKGRRQILETLTDVPAGGTRAPIERPLAGKNAALEFKTDPSGQAIVHMVDPRGGRRAGGRSLTKVIGSGDSLVDQIREFWTEVQDADVAA